MELVLSIDASVSPAQALVVGVRGTELTVIEQHFCPFDSSAALVERLKELGTSIKSRWSNSILFMRGDRHLALKVSLPFRDPRQVARILRPEVEDLVPFDLADFQIAHRMLPLNDAGTSQFHVGLVPKADLEEILPSLREHAVDPLIVTTPSAALQGLYEVYGATLEPHAAVILEQGGMVYGALFMNGVLLSERIIAKDAFASPAPQISAEIELAIENAERTWGVAMPTVYHIAEDGPPLISALPGRTMHALSTVTLFPSLGKRVSLVALLGALFAKDSAEPLAVTNYRNGSLAYYPPLGEVKKGLRTLLPYFIALLLASVLCGVAWYGSREYRIRHLRDLMLSEIRKEIPAFAAPIGEEATVLQQESTTLQNLLKELGSPLTASPLDILSIITEDVTAVGGVAVNRVIIRNGEVRVEGSSPNYKTLDRLESTLKKRKSVFCGVKNDSPAIGSRDNARDFQMTMRICE